MNLFDNPFYLLDATTQGNRWKISALADEKSLLLYASVVTDARSALTDPIKRLAAELRWFPGLG